MTPRETSKVLVVGAGFAGAVYARVLADHGHHVDVIDRRRHIAGNCYDEVHACGVRYHVYGPHLFHTSNQRVVDWLSRFTTWLPFELRGKVRLSDGRLAPIPINLETINMALGTALESEAELAAELAVRTARLAATDNAEEYLVSTVGPELCELFYRPYCRKMWGFDLTQLHRDAVDRVSLRSSFEDRYFAGDTFQALPADGYTDVFRKILTHPRIRLRLGVAFEDELADQFDACFNSMSIDEYFHHELGSLRYRSTRFHHRLESRPASSPPPLVVLTDDTPYKRETWWHVLPGHDVAPGDDVLRTFEEPCEFHAGSNERLYPVIASDGRDQDLYNRYASRPARHRDMKFIGRCGGYKYLDMHQVINQSLVGAQRWLRSI